MKASFTNTRTCSNLQLVEIVLVVVLAIGVAIVSLGEETATVIGSKYFLYPQWWYVDAFCIGSSGSSSIGRGRYHRYITTSSSSTLAGSRPSENDSSDNKNSINEWVSYLEEVFNNSNGNDNYDDGSSNNKDGSGSFSGSGSAVDNTEAVPFQTPVTTYTNALDLLDSIDKAPPNDLTAVLFFAHYCKTCHRANIPFKQLAYDEHSYSDNESPSSSSARDVVRTRFLRFETSALSPNQFRSIGLDRVPFVQLYRNGICVAAFSATQTTGRTRTTTKIVLRPRLLENLDACKRRSLADWSAFRKNHAREIENNEAARMRLRAELVAGYHSGSQCDSAIGSGTNANSDGYNDYNNDNERRYRSVRTLTSEDELLSLVVRENEKNRNGDGDDNGSIGTDESVVIMFHSHFDQSCLRAQHKFRKIADQRRQQQHDRRMISSPSCTMARIESSLLSDETLKRLGIQRYPHIQIYRGSSDPDGRITNDNNSTHAKPSTTKQCVASFSIPRSFLFGRMIHESLDTIDNRTPEEWADFYKHHKHEIASQQVALEKIVREGNKRHHRRRSR